MVWTAGVKTSTTIRKPMIEIFGVRSHGELKLHNGEGCGKKNVENCLAVFDVVLPFGSSTLEAKGFGEKLTGDAGRKDGNTEDVMEYLGTIHCQTKPIRAGSWDV